MSSKKDILGIDFDDVVFDCNTSIMEFHNARYGTAYRREDNTTYFFEDVWGVSSQEVGKRIYEYYDSDFHHHAAIIDGAKEALAVLKDRYEIVLVTARGEQVRRVTEAWLSKHLPEITRSYFTGRPPRAAPGVGTKKSDMCRELGIRYFVEDTLHQTDDLIENAPGTQVFLMDSPWNQGRTPEGAIRVRSWGEIRAALMDR